MYVHMYMWDLSFTAWGPSLFSVVEYKKESADCWDGERASCAEGLRLVGPCLPDDNIACMCCIAACIDNPWLVDF